jgi:signal transduction protein with GAF and PtsI domain
MEAKVPDKGWEEIKEKLKETHLDLTDEDLDQKSTDIDDFLERLARKLNKSKQQVKELIESISANSGIAG